MPPHFLLEKLMPDTKTKPAAPKPTAKKVEKAAPAPKVIWYESREREPSSFDCMGIKPIRNYSNGRLEWEVPSEMGDRFARNHFVSMGRIVRKD